MGENMIDNLYSVIFEKLDLILLLLSIYIPGLQNLSDLTKIFVYSVIVMVFVYVFFNLLLFLKRKITNIIDSIFIPEFKKKNKRG